MEEIFSVLLRLLKEHSCVIIPDLGGFVVNAKPAVVDYASSFFMPPSKELLFNSHLKHNDGLLAHAMMQDKHLSFDEATKQIVQAVRKVKEALTEKGVYPVGKNGSFVATEGGYSFRLAEMQVYDLSSFGLREFYFPQLEKTETVAQEVKPKVKYSFPSLFVGSVAAVFALFLLCQPLNNDARVDTANFASIPLSEVVLPQKSYYVVMDKFQVEAEAEAYVDSLSAQLGSDVALEVLRMDGKYLVATKAAKSLSQACEVRDEYASLLSDSDVLQSSFILGIYK